MPKAASWDAFPKSIAANYVSSLHGWDHATQCMLKTGAFKKRAAGHEWHTVNKKRDMLFHLQRDLRNITQNCVLHQYTLKPSLVWSSSMKA